MDICKNNNKTPCPDLIILGTNQVILDIYIFDYHFLYIYI